MSITTTTTSTTPAITPTTIRSRDITIGYCVWAIDRQCPDTDIKFYLYTRRNIMDRQYIHIDETLEKSNLTNSYFNVRNPTKIVIHGYNSDMFMHPLYIMREEYLAEEDYNIIYVDWSILSPSPCYMSAVHNTKHAGACAAQLVQRIRDAGSSNIHIIGFSLGAQLANYMSNNLEGFIIPRITGLDPAMPLFVTAGAKDKLDETDAEFVDVIHTNALVQGKLERCGHADFYMNGGIMQPGCYAGGTNPFACSHQRATTYYMESIRSDKGFWGWHCSSYISYLLGMCPPTNNLVKAGEYIKRSSRGMFFIETNDIPPYALGKWTDPPTLGTKRPILILTPTTRLSDPLMQQIDEWGKLDFRFNNQIDTTNANSLLNHSYTYFNGKELQPLTVKNENKTDLQDWHETRQNLTKGIIDTNIFSMPKIQSH